MSYTYKPYKPYQQSSFYGETDDDYYAGYGKSTYNSTGYNSSYYGGYTQYSYDSSWFSKYQSSFDSSKDKREFKKEIHDIARDKFLPTNVKITTAKTSFLKKRKLEVNINQNELGKFKGKESKLMDLYDKLPYNSDVIDSESLKYFITGDIGDLEKFVVDGAGNVLNEIKEYFGGTISYDQYRKKFKPIEHKAPPKGKKAIAEAEFEWGWNMGTEHKLCDEVMYKKVLHSIRSKISLRSTINTEASLRKGSRINRGFIDGTSYKPLMTRTTDIVRKKKIMFIVDCSGSMWYPLSNEDPSYKALSFVGGVVNSGKFDVDHVILHSSSGWRNVAKPFKRWELFTHSGGWEGFESVDDNLSRDMVSGVDYIVTLTDLCIDEGSQQGLYDYLKKGKKHLVLSFQEGGDIKGMHVRKIEEMSDMINGLVTIVG